MIKKELRAIFFFLLIYSVAETIQEIVRIKHFLSYRKQKQERLKGHHL